MLFLVRHAMPVVSRELAPGGWPLTPEGRARGEQLRQTLPARAYTVCSDERKAWETLGGAPSMVRDPRFNEVLRFGELWGADHRRLRRLYIEGAEHAGWEAHSAVVRRFDSGVTAHTAIADGRPVVLVTHGMAMTLWMVSRGLVPAADAGRFWSELAFPDCYAFVGGLTPVRRHP
jgi:broad specificity phosphatase PhoE